MPKATGHAIHVWKFSEAPKQFRELSDHGGDEDWVALVPKELVDLYIPWMQEGSPFGCCSVSEHKLEGGCVVRIGAHA